MFSWVGTRGIGIKKHNVVGATKEGKGTPPPQKKKKKLPVCVWKQCSLKESASNTSIPEDLCSGDSLAAIAYSL